MSEGRVVSVNIGVPRQVDWAARLSSTAIDKRPHDGPVAVGPLGLDGDTQVDTANHGGLHQAVYAFARSDARWWERELGRSLAPGAFGENLTVEDLEASDAEIGERWRVGGTLLEVTSPRIPCHTVAGFWDVPDLVRRFTEQHRPGCYLRVLESGEIAADDRVEVAHRPGHRVTVTLAMRARTGATELAPRLGDIPALPPKWTDWLDRVLGSGERDS